MGPRGEFWKPNIARFGRALRAVAGALLLLGGIALGLWVLWWLGVIVALAGVFALFEAARGWCFLRACGLKTRH